MPIMSPSMAEAALPKRLDAIRFVDNETVLTGSLDVNLFKRFQEAVEDVNGPVDYKLAFQRDEAKFTEWDENGLKQASGYVFYNIS